MILIASGTEKAIQVKAYQPGLDYLLVCLFVIEGMGTVVNAEMRGDTVYCNAIEFKYSSQSPNSTVELTVFWDMSKPLDNPNNLHGNLTFISDNPIDFENTRLFQAFLILISGNLSMQFYGR